MQNQEFNKNYEQAITIVKKIKTRNDLITKQSQHISESKLLQQINTDKNFFQNQISRLNSILKRMEQSYLTPSALKKLNDLKKEAKIQISRNEYLIEQLIKSTFEKVETKDQNKNKSGNVRAEIELGSYQDSEKRVKNGSYEQRSIQLQKSQNYNLEFQTHLETEKQNLIKQLHKDMLNINNIINQTAELTYQQGEEIDIIGENIVTTHINIDHTQSNMQQANQYQKKSSKKIWGVAIIIIIVILIIVGIVILAI